MENRGEKMDSKVESWLAGIRALYEKDRKLEEYKKEEPYLRLFLNKLEEEQKPGGKLSLYKLGEPKAKGGSGIVFTMAHNHVDTQQLIIKFSRPTFELDLKTGLENEIEVLPQLNHFNIIKVIDLGKIEIKSGQLVDPPLHYIIEPNVSNEVNLSVFVDELANQVKESNDDLLDDALRKLVDIIQQWVCALSYIHKSDFVYLDVKPDNAVVDKDGRLLIIDFGTTLKKVKADPTPTPISFSSSFAHPDLQKIVNKISSSRLRPSIRRMDLKAEFDYYALGKSILKLLQRLCIKYPHDFPQRPMFKSLYFLATRLLDGQNEPPENTDDRKKSLELPEVFETLEKDDYKTIKYVNLDDVKRDLEKELGKWNLENEIPELTTYPASTIRVVPDLNTAKTERLLSLIEHPLIGRLNVVSQLGLVTLIYPTANHSRYDHVLGAYTYTRYYVTALFHDTQNCMFRNLIDEKDVKAVLLASFLHDLGQYPLAHDLEEVHKQIFNHSEISTALLEDTMKDKKGRTLKDIIENEETGWGVKINQVKKILEAQSSDRGLVRNQTVQDLKDDLLSAIIDGPIDADKADYIIRDSINARVPYGAQLDIERLLSVLTTARIKHPVYKVTVGVYEKGIASASAFSLARYLLHASVYWHHTSRILKAMLQYATVMLLPKEVFDVEADQNKIDEIHQRLIEFIKKDLIPPNDALPRNIPVQKPKNLKMDPNAKPTDDASNDISRQEKEMYVDWYPGMCRTDWQMLFWLKRLPPTAESSRGIDLIDMILRRDLYKRVYTLQNEGKESTDDAKIVDRLQGLKWREKIKLSNNMQKAIQEILNKQDGAETQLQPSADRVQEILKEKLAIIVDIPHYKKFSKDRPLIYVPELQSKTYYTDISATPSNNLSDGLEALMKSTAPVRVLSHPELRQWIGYWILPDEMRSILVKAMS
jgi:HD superfamily phosphohydrolase/serine/threonine protein kinase